MTSPRETPYDSQNEGRVALGPRLSDAVDPVRGSPSLLDRVRARTGLMVFGVMGGLVAAYLVWLVVHGPQPPQSGWINGWAEDAFYLVAAVVCVIGGLRRRPGSYIPLVFGLALIFTMLGNTVLTVYALHGIPPPPPTAADVFGLGFTVLCFVGIGLMARNDRERLNPRDLLDGGIAALGVGAVCAAFVLAKLPHRQGQSTLGSAVVLAYPIGFVILVLIVVGAATVSARRSRGAWVALAVAFVLVAVPSAVNATTAPSSPVAFSILNSVAWPTAILLLAASMWIDPGMSDPMPVSRGTVVWIPALACCAALAVLLTATVSRVDDTASALAAAALVLVILRGYSELRNETAVRVRTEEGLRASEARYRQLAEEQASLRQVATLVAQGAAAVEVFTAVARETKRILEFDTATLLRLEPDGMVTVSGSVATLPPLTVVGDRKPPLAGGVVDRVLRTGRPARIDGFEGAPGSPGDELNELGYGGAAAAPVFVEGRLWGVLRAAWSKERSVSPSSEKRLLQFSELIATALANADAREELRRVAEEQAALRRVATLVARGEPPSAVFAGVAAEAGRVIPGAGVALVGRYDLDEESIEFVGAWSPAGEPGFVGSHVVLGGHNVATLVFQRNEPARVDRILSNDTPATSLARDWAHSSAGAPIDVEGRLWGVLTVGAVHEDELPLGTEYRLAQFADLVASAISNSQARGDLARVADEQTALRRVATLVAKAAPASAVFASVAEEVGRLLAVDAAAVRRYLADGTGEIVASWSLEPGVIPVGLRAKPTSGTVTATVRETGRPARVDHYGDDAGGAARELGIHSTVGVPITVEGELWGLIAVVSTGEEPPPPGTEDRLAGFTELVATAIANAQAREELRTIADEQAAIRRVATLVAQPAPPSEVFAAVAEEVGHLLVVEGAFVVRYEQDDTVTTVASSHATDKAIPVGLRRPVVQSSLSWLVRETGSPARIDYSDDPVALEYAISSSVAAPITVEGHLWGYIAASTTQDRLPSWTEARLADFTELVATAIANAQAQIELQRYAEEQSALRRVATLVAKGVSPEDVFTAVTEEVGRALGSDFTGMSRYNGDGTATVLGEWTRTDAPPPMAIGERFNLGGQNETTLVAQTGLPARVDNYEATSGTWADAARVWGFGSCVGVPIIVEDRPWGVVSVANSGTEILPESTEARLIGFTDMVATAIANAQTRDELRTIADEQAALGRVATLVARGEAPTAVFAAVAEQIGQLLGTDDALVARFESDDSVTIVASWTATGKPLPVGLHRHVEPGDGVTPLVRETNRPARIDSTTYYSELGVESAVAAPITVEGQLWGVVGVALRGPKPAPPDTEERLAAFTGIVAIAIANAESRAELMASRARIVAAADGARRRIERDLHDGTQQRLVSLVLQLREARAIMPPGAAAQLDTFARGLDGALEELLELARGIHPTILTKGGLGPALNALARRSAVPVEVVLRIEGRLPEPVEVAAYYVVSEALTNATKHAHATAISVDADADAGADVLRIAVCDDGIGGADFSHGTGLVGLKDRVEALGGRILLDSNSGKGTMLRAEFPILATTDSLTSG